MSSVVIKVENLGKQYRLGQVGTGTLSNDFNRWLHKIRGKEDPYLKIGDVNDRTKAGSSDLVWALKDINFEVRQGEVLGIIGKNGAGKSTLLKILSRVTGPSVGDIKVKGRIASLLEVGTGFHPELTGRENIFLNGAILGMTKQEIRSKFDEIVDFSGVERYIDTPVKRYSSGMYVRLAFAVAAHLEPEILIVDEVLAVGDAEFQKKCLGKMKDVSGQGRTVLFVSHNLQAVKTLCDTAIYLKNGTIKNSGPCDIILNEYSEDNYQSSSSGIFENKAPNEFAYLKKATIHDSEMREKSEFSADEKIIIQFEIEKLSDLSGMYAYFGVQRADDLVILETDTLEQSSNFLDTGTKGTFLMSLEIPARILNTGTYFINYGLGSPNHWNFQIESLQMFLKFNVVANKTVRDPNRRSINSTLLTCKLNNIIQHSL